MRIKCLQVVTTCSSEAEARRIGRALVEMRLAACAQVGGPVRSTYWWQGKAEEAAEWVCILKCTAKRYAEVEAAIKRMHSYTIPEIIAVPVEMGNIEYLKWLEAETVPAVAAGSPGTGDLSGVKRRQVPGKSAV